MEHFQKLGRLDSVRFAFASNSRHPDRPRLKRLRDHAYFHAAYRRPHGQRSRLLSYDKNRRKPSRWQPVTGTSSRKAIAERSSPPVKAVAFDRGLSLSWPRGRIRHVPRGWFSKDKHIWHKLKNAKATAIRPAARRRLSENISSHAAPAVVKGGRRFSFAAMVVVGDGKGKPGTTARPTKAAQRVKARRKACAW